MGLFRDHILRNPQYNIGKALNTVILDQIKMERDGDIIDHATIRSCVYMLEALYENEDENENEKIYLTSFEGKTPYPVASHPKHQTKVLTVHQRRIS